MGSLIDLSKFAPKSIYVEPYTAIPGKRSKIEYLFKVKGTQFVGRKQVQSLSGKTGHGKSTFGLCLLAACACGNFELIETTTGGPIKALWIDTEQGCDLLTERLEQVLRMAAIEHLPFKEIYYKRLRARSVAEYDSIEEMKKEIEKEISTMQPDFIFLDGVTDLVENLNDIPEARKILKWVEHTAFNSNCAVMCVTHQNKNASNAKGDKLGGIQGNVGSFLAKKAFDSFVVEIADLSGESRVILHEKTRTYKKLDPLYMTATMSETLEITLGTEKPTLDQFAEMEKQQKQKERLWTAIEEAETTGNKKANTNRLTKIIRYKFNMGPTEANKLITQGSSLGWISYDQDRKVYRANKPDEDDL